MLRNLIVISSNSFKFRFDSFWSIHVTQSLLGKVKHVGGEERLTVLLKVLLAGLDETIEPRQPGLLAVVGVEDHWHTVELGDLQQQLDTAFKSSRAKHECR